MSIDKCRSMDCKATLIVEGAKFYVCKHQLAHASDYFRRVVVFLKAQEMSWKVFIPSHLCRDLFMEDDTPQPHTPVLNAEMYSQEELHLAIPQEANGTFECSSHFDVRKKLSFPLTFYFCLLLQI